MYALVLGGCLTAQTFAQDFNARIELPASNALITAAGQLVKEGVPITELRNYTATYGHTDNSYVVRFDDRKRRRTSSFVVNGTSARPVAAAVPSGQRQIGGDFVSVLYRASAVWESSPIGMRHDIATTGVTIVHPFANAPAVYWAYFSPPDQPRAGLAVGCGLSRGYSVNLDTAKIKPLKPVC